LWMRSGSFPAGWGSKALDSAVMHMLLGPRCGPFATQGRAYGGPRMRAGDQLRSRTQNSVAPATAAGIISTFTTGTISAR
jgi:hypothetical protein